MAFHTEDFSHYIVTGRYYNSTRRFRDVYTDAIHALSINLWNGRVWGVHAKTKKRVLLKRVIN